LLQILLEQIVSPFALNIELAISKGILTGCSQRKLLKLINKRV